MRISGWSSDVCSSDLAEHLDQQEHGDRQAERGVEVGGGHGAQVGVRGIVAGGDIAVGPGPRQEVHRDKVDEVHQEHEHERSEEHTSELQSLMRISYAVFCLKKKKKRHKRRI